MITLRHAACALLLGAALLAGCDISESGTPASTAPVPAATTTPVPAESPADSGGAYPGPGTYPAPTAAP